MAEDYLWKYINLVASHCGSEVSLSDDYCAATRCYDWETGKPMQCEAGNYEHTLMEFLLADPAVTTRAGLDVLVIVGGIGTGKSTTVGEMMRRIASQGRRCSALTGSGEYCTHLPILLTLNTGEIYGESGKRGVDKSRVRLQLSDFWNMAASNLEQLLGEKFSFEIEVAFWFWALGQGGVRNRSLFVHRWLNDCEHQIRALVTGKAYAGWSIEDIAQSLERRRSELMREIPERDLVWYRVFQLIYAIKEMKSFECGCRYIFLDNIDQLEPDVQREIVDFVILLSDVLRARTLIAIRPLTWERSVHVHMLVRTENHFSASVREVLLARVRRLANDVQFPREAVEYLKSLVLALTAQGTLWGNMFDATSGLSLRFAIRNLLNLGQSKLLPPLSAHSDPFSKMRASEVARAFFFGDGESIISDCFENLYALGTDMRREYRLIKPRIIDYLIRLCDGCTTLEVLGGTMRRFGYKDAAVVKAVNDLLLRSRPLLWSQDGHQISTLSSRAMIAVTPIGRGYYEKLFGQLYYDEVCMARTSSEVVSIEAVLDFHRQLWDQDKAEISYAIRKHGAGFYLRLYPRERPAISAIHAANLREGVERREISPPPGYDTARDVFIAAEVERLLPKW